MQQGLETTISGTVRFGALVYSVEKCVLSDTTTTKRTRTFIIAWRGKQISMCFFLQQNFNFKRSLSGSLKPCQRPASDDAAPFPLNARRGQCPPLSVSCLRIKISLTIRFLHSPHGFFFYSNQTCENIVDPNEQTMITFPKGNVFSNELTVVALRGD